MKRCYKCGEEKPLSDFHKSKNRKDGRNPRCKSCQYSYNKNRYEQDPELFKLKRILSRYQLTKEQYYEAIKNGCEVCGSMQDLHVDHDHSCCPYPEDKKDIKTCGKCIRGILCRACNTAEGMLNSNIELAKSLVRYMEKNIDKY